MDRDETPERKSSKINGIRGNKNVRIGVIVVLLIIAIYIYFTL